ncbi:MAG: divergent polysaccharide deacetylase family protein [Parvularcula sp.]|jgi:polysaccharide deacetylase 2 family uncharacterized protein YibQ|nr:divergent polysaccharide deacetylase family protein [Parvularcula sp.]
MSNIEGPLMKVSRIAAATLGAMLGAFGCAFAEGLRTGYGDERLSPRPDPRPVIAIVIDDLGLDWGRFESVNAMEVPMTLAILPYGSDAQAMIDRVSPRHEVMLHLPMAAERETAPMGPDAVPIGPEDAVRDALLRNLTKISGYSGVNNHTGSRTTSDEAAMAIVLEELRERDLYFLDSRTSPQSVAARVGQSQGAKVIEGTLFLDGDFGRGGEAHVRAQLEQLETTAKRDGFAIGIGHPYPSTIAVLKTWAPEARTRLRFVTTAELAARTANEDPVHISLR